MRALIVGGDHIEPTRRALEARGYDDIVHWTGRKTSDLTRPFPSRIEHMVIVLDYINHNLAKRMKKLAREHAIQIDYVRRKGVLTSH